MSDSWSQPRSRSQVWVQALCWSLLKKFPESSVAKACLVLELSFSSMWVCEVLSSAGGGPSPLQFFWRLNQTLSQRGMTVEEGTHKKTLQSKLMPIHCVLSVMLLQWECQEAGVLGSPFQITNFSAGRNPRGHLVQSCHSTNEEPEVRRPSTIHTVS